jgi:hypothetical protein
MTSQRLAQVGIGTLVLIVIRALAEYFRLRYVHGEALTVAQVTPYVGGALFASVALAAVLVCALAGLYRSSTAIAAAAVLALLVYKVAWIG